jgi:hypothetical protein
MDNLAAGEAASASSYSRFPGIRVRANTSPSTDGRMRTFARGLYAGFTSKAAYIDPGCVSLSNLPLGLISVNGA